jgi:hypothetical protein
MQLKKICCSKAGRNAKAYLVISNAFARSSFWRLAPERWLQGGWKVFFCVPCKKIFYRVTLKNIKNAEFSEYSVKKMNIFGLILGCFFG